jgi:hypothetical protein
MQLAAAENVPEVRIALRNLISIKEGHVHSSIRTAAHFAPDIGLTWSGTLSVLMVRCPKTGREFNSGYRTNGGDLAAVPASFTMRVRCPLCNETHTVTLSKAREASESSR